MPAGGRPGDANALRVNVVVPGMVTDEPDGSVHVFEDLWDRKLRLTAVHNREDGIAALQKFHVEERADALVTGEPAAAYDENDPGAVGILPWGNYVQRQCGPELPAVDDVLLTAEKRRFLCRKHGWHLQRQHTAENNAKKIPLHDKLQPARRWPSSCSTADFTDGHAMS